MCGPHAKAVPQCAIAHFGSSRAASWNEAMAAPWLNPCRNASPCLKYRCASAEVVVTFREYEPSPPKNGSFADTAFPNASAPRTTTAREKNAAAFINETLEHWSSAIPFGHCARGRWIGRSAGDVSTQNEDHSTRSASTGLSRLARRAGNKHASNAAIPRTAIVAINRSGLCADVS